MLPKALSVSRQNVGGVIMEIQMDYRQAEDYILAFTDYEKVPGIAYTSANYDLRRMAKLLQPLGNPHRGTKTVHIAGTKGKGSTAAMVSEVLGTEGYKTGLFTSPHLHTLRERVRVKGVLISEAEFVALVEKLVPIVEAVNREALYGKLTTFEILTALVFAYFKEQQVDYQVLEVGLGGRLDATNIVEADVCVITSISLDHTEVLGNSLSRIAAEKAGIIKPGCVVINAPQTKDVTEVVEMVCDEQGAELIQVGRDVTWRRTGGDLCQQSLVVEGQAGEYKLSIPLLGDYQLENAATAVAALEALARFGVRLSAQAMVNGFSEVVWPGRLQVLSYQPMLVVDGAHNAYSVRRLVEAIEKYFDYSRCFVIFGTSCDKDIRGMAREVALLSHDVVVTHSSHPRAALASVVTDEFARLGIEARTAESVGDALAQTLALAEDKDLVLVVGSLFVVAEAIDRVAGLRGACGASSPGS